MNTEAKTGTSNRAYDIELADFLRDVQQRNREMAEQAKHLLQPRLDVA
jgi:hypothetical protein